MTTQRDWLSALVEFTKTHYDATHQAFLLAQTASALKAEGIYLEEALAGRRLKAAIEAEASDALELVQHPHQRLVWGVVPKGTPLPEDASTLFPEKQRTTPLEPSLNLGVWSAFVKPLADDSRRFLDIYSTPIRFSDRATGENDPPGIEVLRSDIISPHLSGIEKSEGVKSRVRAWAQRNNIDFDQLYAKRRLEKKKTREEWLDKIYNLEEDDLKRISIPLDIVKKLIYKT